MTLTEACNTVRESMRATETDLNDEAEQAQFAKDYGTDSDIQRHVLDWAYMYEAPTAQEVAEDPAYGEFCAAWEYIMANGTHPLAQGSPLYNVYTLTEGMVGEEESAETIEEARDIYSRFLQAEQELKRASDTYAETTVHLYCPSWGDMVAEECIPAIF